MKRRSFLSLLGAAGIAPAIPSVAAPATAAAGYNRYMYGLAVFHARTRSSVSAADLVTRLKVNAVQAEAMIGEMTADGVVTPVLKAASRVVNPHHHRGYEKLQSTLRKSTDWLRENETPANVLQETDDTESMSDMQEDQDG